MAGEAPEAVTDPWSLYDFFVVGIACDVVGAFFISRIFIRRSASFAQDFWTPGGINNELAIVGERTDAMFGVAVLLIGFLFQAVGYILLLDGVKAKSSGEAPALSSVIIAVTAVAVLLVVRRFSRQTIIRRTVVKFVMARPKADLPEAVWYMTVGSDFVKWGTAMGRPPLNEEELQGNRSGYIRREFKVDLPSDVNRTNGHSHEVNHSYEVATKRCRRARPTLVRVGVGALCGA